MVSHRNKTHIRKARGEADEAGMRIKPRQSQQVRGEADGADMRVHAETPRAKRAAIKKRHRKKKATTPRKERKGHRAKGKAAPKNEKQKNRTKMCNFRRDLSYLLCVRTAGPMYFFSGVCYNFFILSR